MLDCSVVRWIFGLVGVDVIIGYFLSYGWYALLCKLMGEDQKYKLWPPYPLKENNYQTGHLTGILERIFFTTAIATAMGGTAIAMMAWITVKYYILWPGFTRIEPTKRGTVSLLSSMGSMLLAILGAEVCKGKLW
jgi:hypothetical protein